MMKKPEHKKIASDMAYPCGLCQINLAYNKALDRYEAYEREHCIRKDSLPSVEEIGKIMDKFYKVPRNSDNQFNLMMCKDFRDQIAKAIHVRLKGEG